MAHDNGIALAPPYPGETPTDDIMMRELYGRVSVLEKGGTGTGIDPDQPGTPIPGTIRLLSAVPLRLASGFVRRNSGYYEEQSTLNPSAPPTLIAKIPTPCIIHKVTAMLSELWRPNEFRDGNGQLIFQDVVRFEIGIQEGHPVIPSDAPGGLSPMWRRWFGVTQHIIHDIDQTWVPLFLDFRFTSNDTRQGLGVYTTGPDIEIRAGFLGSIYERAGTGKVYVAIQYSAAVDDVPATRIADLQGEVILSPVSP